jgi:exopolysaccharide production protein ExoY
MPTLPQVSVVDHGTTREIPIGGILKRGFDIFIAINAIILSAPLMLLVYLLIRLCSPGPGFYVHRRVGHNGRDFGCIKFRTMYPDSDARLAQLLRNDPVALREYAEGAKLRHDPRIIAGIGAVLRRASLDELPQFFNVLKGDMSVIGPRPVTRRELDQHYGAHAADVLSARPGISGLWQVSGRNAVSYAERVRLDLEYVRGWAFRADISILLRTVSVVVLGRGAY